MPKHLRATWPRPEQSHLLPEACSPDGTDKRRQQRQTAKSKFLYGPVSPNFCARRSVMMILNLSESLAKPLVVAKLNMAYLSSLNKRAKLLSSYLPVSPSRVLRAPGTSPYHLVPKHLRATWPRPEQSHLLPEACSPDGTDKRRQRQRQTERPPPEPSNILKRFCALYDVEIRYYKKKVSKLYCLFNRNPPIVRICLYIIHQNFIDFININN